jgi:hypothetical protein
MSRDPVGVEAPYALPDDALLRACRIDRFCAGGPGGQHTNRTESAVRLVHPLAEAQCQDHRDRARNQADALRRLRVRLACSVRGAADPAWLTPWRSGTSIRIGANADAFPCVAALALDALAEAAGALAAAAAALQVSTSQLAKLLAADGEVRAAANAIRAAHGLGALH